MDCKANAIASTLKQIEEARTSLETAEKAEQEARLAATVLRNRVNELQKTYDQQIRAFKQHPSLRSTDWWQRSPGECNLT